MNINDSNILSLIINQIDNSTTYCRLSQVSKKLYELCKRLLIHKTLHSKYLKVREHRTLLPTGILHGNVRGEIMSYPQVHYFKSIEKINCRWDFLYDKTYKSGKLHGYYTFGPNLRKFFINGEEIDHKFLVKTDAIRLYFESSLYNDIELLKTKIDIFKVTYEDLEKITKDESNYKNEYI
tara:strand:+ start:17571 stop:18110 length:540 start_codon:yes stop_codon:yes gene_type:complete